jgi:uncharacterized iron-regulated membrane protein
VRALLPALFLISLTGAGLCFARVTQLERWRSGWEFWRGKGNPQAGDEAVAAALKEIGDESARWTTLAFPLTFVMLASGVLLVRRLARRRDYVYVPSRYRVKSPVADAGPRN